MDFENYILKNYGFFISFSQTSSKDNNGKGIFSIFTLYSSVLIFLCRRSDVVKLDKILDPETNFEFYIKK